MALIPGQKKRKNNGENDGRASAEDEVLLREIDEAVRQDEYAQLAKRYGGPLLALVVLGLAAFGGYLWWQAREEAKLEAQSEMLVAALDQAGAGNFDSALREAEKLADAQGAARYSALFLRAAIALQKGEAAEAVRIYSTIAKDEKAPRALRDLATIREVASNFDRRKAEDVIKRLEPLAKPDEPWFASAGEMVAMAYLDLGKKQEAGELFAQIAKDSSAPASLRERARQMAGLLGVDAIEDVDKLLEEQDQGAAQGASGVAGSDLAAAR